MSSAAARSPAARAGSKRGRSSSLDSSASSGSQASRTRDKVQRTEGAASASSGGGAKSKATTSTAAAAPEREEEEGFFSLSGAADLPDEKDRELYRLVVSILNNWRVGSQVLSEGVLRALLHRVRPLLLSQPMLVRVEAPVNVCGDIHGQILDLVSIFRAGGLPPASRYLFLGDYVDRGKYGTEVITVLFGLKVLFPDRVFLLRGNHETDSICRTYGFFDECKRRFSVRMFREFIDVFNVLPVAGLIEDIALCMHGGLSPQLRHLRQIENIPRPLVVPDEGLACDLLWSDPDAHAPGWQPNERGVSYTFDESITKQMCEMLNIDLVCRAHQVVDNGYAFFANRHLVTVFSASNYCGEFTNKGAMMIMDENCRCGFHIFQPQYSPQDLAFIRQQQQKGM